ncbi:MAG: hypothetical protein AAFV85_23460 [Cyanobacteria bacterium J06634_6]
MFETEFNFTLPKGYADGEGNLHRQGTMRLAKAMDEIVPLRDPRVKDNPAYATVLILSRVVIRLGALDAVSPRVIENLYAADLNYLYDLYREVNDLEPLSAEGQSAESTTKAQPAPKDNLLPAVST